MSLTAAQGITVTTWRFQQHIDFFLEADRVPRYELLADVCIELNFSVGIVGGMAIGASNIQGVPLFFGMFVSVWNEWLKSESHLIKFGHVFI